MWITIRTAICVNKQRSTEKNTVRFTRHVEMFSQTKTTIKMAATRSPQSQFNIYNALVHFDFVRNGVNRVLFVLVISEIIQQSFCSLHNASRSPTTDNTT